MIKDWKTVLGPDISRAWHVLDLRVVKLLLFAKLTRYKGFPAEGGFLLRAATATAAKLLQSCPTLCDPMGGSPPGSPVLGILQARTLEWVAISFSNA